MADRLNTSKKRAQRIDLNYFKRPHWLRRARLWLSLIFTGLAVAWLGRATLAKDRSPYSMGPVSSSHASFANQCNFCHVDSGALRDHAPDRACQTCHDGPLHSSRQETQPECSSCHLEHQGQVGSLRRFGDRTCTRCHADLKLTGAQPSVHTQVTDFATGHPDFAVKAPNVADPGKLRFSHKTHLTPSRMTAFGARKLECMECHGRPVEPTATNSTVLPRVSVRGGGGLADSSPVDISMAPIRFSTSCAGCHSLAFDSKLDDYVPHDRPAVIHDFLVSHYGKLMADPASPLKVSAGETALTRVAEAESILWAVTCKACHTLVPQPSGIPEVLPPALPTRWLPGARFDHRAHAIVECASCHQAPGSDQASDILMPSIATCRACHQTGGAESGCLECHGYHDWTRAKPGRRKFTIQELRGGPMGSPRAALNTAGTGGPVDPSTQRP